MPNFTPEQQAAIAAATARLQQSQGPWTAFQSPQPAQHGPWDDFTPEQQQALQNASQRLQQAQPQQSSSSQSASPIENAKQFFTNIGPASEQQMGVAGQAVTNIPESFGNLLSGIGHAVIHPIDTAKGIVDLGAGELQKITPKPLRDLINRMDWNPEAAQKAEQTATTINDFYKNRYGSTQGFQDALAHDPVGVASDLSAALGVGGMLIPGKAGVALSNASNLTNPLTLAGKAIKGTVKLGATLGKTALGVSTGAGSNAIEEAAKAGYTGDQSFLDNMQGKVSPTDVLDAAKSNLEQMKIAKNLEYRNNMSAMAQDKTVLDFKGIDAAVNNAQAMTQFKGITKNAPAAAAVQKVADAVDAWKKLNPADFHTPEGLDALKQQIGGVMESLPFEQKTARLAVGNVYNAVKNEIVNQAPGYANTMKAYSDASDQITEIQKALLGNQKASADTAMRKLQSLMRNNVNTNYGNRLNLAKELEQAGGKEIIPALAGQALNSWEPRGLARLGAGATAIGGYLNPHLLAMLPFESPRLMGTALYGAGRAAGTVGNVLSHIPITNQSAKLAALLAGQAGLLNQRANILQP